jgi:hypothetical protein
MNIHRRLASCSLVFAAILAVGCSPGTQKSATPAEPTQPVLPAFHVDPATAGSISGTVHFTGKRPARKVIDMSNEPACVAAHKARVLDESVRISSAGQLANAFIYVKSGLEGKRFDVPADPVKIDQNGCWFHPRVLGIQVLQSLHVTNSDPVTHNIHPMAQVNREWNHSQGAGDPAINRKFVKPEIMIPVKCNIHSWMHAWIGVVDNPFFAVSKPDGSYTIANLPPGTYTIGIWQESLGTQEQQVAVAAKSNSVANFSFTGK